MKAMVVLAMTFALIGAQDSQGAEKGSFTIMKGLSFSESNPELSLDLYVPDAVEKPFPCVMVIQGGGFLPQDGQRFRPFAEYLAQRGFAAALISYRGRPKHTYLETIADTKATVRFVRSISGQYGIDPERIGATGRSAGGTLAGLLAVTGGMPEFEGKSGHAQYSSSIQAAVTYAGVFDFVARFSNPQQLALQPNRDSKVLSNGEWIGTPFSESDPEWQRASAIYHVDAMDPPVLFMHCKDDATVPWLQSRDMYEKLKAAGIASEIKYFESGGHGFKDRDEEGMAAMVEFFQKTLGRKD